MKRIHQYFIKAFKELTIYFGNCGRQSYDNVFKYSRIHKGMQAILKQINHMTIWVLHIGHSLNLFTQTT